MEEREGPRYGIHGVPSQSSAVECKWTLFFVIGKEIFVRHPWPECMAKSCVGFLPA